MRFRHVVLLAILLVIFLARFRPQRFRESLHPPAATRAGAVRITQFYAAQPQIALGDKTVLCYGVENAAMVRLDPPIEKLWPSFVRCFDIAPAHTTKYTLIAQSAAGDTVRESAIVEVGPARPKLIDISVNKLEVAKGEQIVLCFKAQNASNYDVGGLRPVSVQTGGGMGQVIATPERGCFVDHPRKTTTYIVKVTGPGGMDSEKVTVTVK
jgi:hypothetical protein